MFRPLTHEQFHTGLSSVGNDAKWSDMRNIRSQGGRSVAIQPKVVIHPIVGLHTVEALGKRMNYAFGSNRSFVFSGDDNNTSNTLWRVKVAHRTPEDETPRGLTIRGAYSEETPNRLRVTFVDGKPYAEPVEETIEETPFECYGCCGEELVEVVGTVRDEDGESLPGGVVQIFQFGALIFNLIPNGGGIWRVNIPQGFYTLRIVYTGLPIYSIPWNVTIAEERDDYLYSEGYGKALLAGAKLVVWINPQFGPMVSAPTPVAINGITLTATAFDPPGSDPGFAEYVLDYETLSDIYAAQPVGVDEYEITVPLLEGGSSPDAYPGVQLFSHTAVLLLNDMTGASGTLTYTP